MLLKSDASDACELAFAEWRARMPFWNNEADRCRAAALEARRTGSAPPGITDDIELVLEQVREALHRCDTLVASAAPGDFRLPLLIKATAEFEALLESLHGSLERIEDLGGSAPRARPLVVIAHRPDAGDPALR
jgi:hypothetical protein